LVVGIRDGGEAQGLGEVAWEADGATRIRCFCAKRLGHGHNTRRRSKIRNGERVTWWTFTLVDIHWELVGVPTPSPSYNRIMSCIIGHANPTTGR